MTSGKEPSADPVAWLPAERLGGYPLDHRLRVWLIGKGLLTERLKAVCGARFALRVIDLWPGELDAGLRLSLRAGDRTGLFRDVEMRCADQVLVFAQTVMPDSTVSAHPWLAELGDAALGETLGGLSGVERSPYEYAWLPADDGLTARALRAAGAEPARLWARRSRFALRGAPLLIQEVFLPSLSRTPDFA